MAGPRERKLFSACFRALMAHEQPWEIPRIDVSYPIRFYGHVENIANSDRAIWSGGQECLAVAYDTPIVSFSFWTQ